jgi:hypothetical protein
VEVGAIPGRNHIVLTFLPCHRSGAASARSFNHVMPRRAVWVYSQEIGKLDAFSQWKKDPAHQ